MTEIDILAIDLQIKNNIGKDTSMIPVYQQKIDSINSILESNKNQKLHIRQKLEKSKLLLKLKIEEIHEDIDLQFYISDTNEFIKQYKKILDTPIKKNFLGVKIKENKEKKKIIKQYLSIASKYSDLNINNTEENPVCHNCQNNQKFDYVEDNIVVCMKCYTRQTVMKHNSSYNDIDRVNISSKYTYDRKIHFRDCIKQYQGKIIFLITKLTFQISVPNLYRIYTNFYLLLF